MDAFILTSSAFKSGEAIPLEYTCDGDNVSPPLAWADAPAGTQSLALIVRDPDAPGGTFIHWVAYNIPPTTRALAKSVRGAKRASDGTLQGQNDFARIGYGGPCPPPGPTHHYHFTLYALDTRLAERAGDDAAQLDSAMNGHILGQAALVGTYHRS
jgi:Raf kinase inhibitor-like YbhB/YbcL family protein